MNVNCWSTNNNRLHTKLVTFNNPNIICVTETHLRDSEEIEVENYRFYGLNRPNNPRSTHGSGGVGILIEADIYNSCAVQKCCEIDDNVLGLMVTNKYSGCTYLVICIYLPPDSSRYGQNNEQILNALTCELYQYAEVDDIFICGDFNA